ncbi:MAG: mechanosensitive ion channel family protein, partial [Pseudomonadota bacterium]
KLFRQLIQSIPLVLAALIIVPLAWIAARAVSRGAKRFFLPRVASPLLARILARAVALPVFLFGLFIILQLAGLTRFALTVVGGTGVAGIIFGFAFRDIAENFLASVLLSIRRPFEKDDFVVIDGHEGLVQQMNTRSTVLMTVDGNHVQIPNATVFKNVIVNRTSSRNSRGEFAMSIGYDHSIAEAQKVVVDVLEAHTAILVDPGPMVLVDDLGSSSITLRAYYWFDMQRYSPIKLRSALVRQTLRALEDVGITAPDDAREVIFPDGVPLIDRRREEKSPSGTRDAPVTSADNARANGLPSDGATTIEQDRVHASDDEGGLESDTADLRRQAAAARTPEGGANLLDG